MPADQIASCRPLLLEEEEEAGKLEVRSEPEIWPQRLWIVVWMPCGEASGKDQVEEGGEGIKKDARGQSH